ncbi:MAG: hypothetical protein RR759_05640, partial [Ruthenibacterium sp.]
SRSVCPLKHGAHKKNAAKHNCGIRGFKTVFFDAMGADFAFIICVALRFFSYTDIKLFFWVGI